MLETSTTSTSGVAQFIQPELHSPVSFTLCDFIIAARLDISVLSWSCHSEFLLTQCRVDIIYWAPCLTWRISQAVTKNKGNGRTIRRKKFFPGTMLDHMVAESDIDI